MGQCRRRSPDGSKLDPTWPITSWNSWCGEHEPIEEPESESEPVGGYGQYSISCLVCGVGVSVPTRHDGKMSPENTWKAWELFVGAGWDRVYLEHNGDKPLGWCCPTCARVVVGTVE